MILRLFNIGSERTQMVVATTNADGRCDGPLLEGEAFAAGQYELEFDAGDYFAENGPDPVGREFLTTIVIRFNIAEPDQHYHVPLLVSPFGYSTYRGS